MRKSVKSLSAAAALLMLLGALPVAAQGPGGRASPVVAAEADMRAMAPVIETVGEVVSLHDARVAAEVPGRLVWVAQEGRELKTGEPLARIDDEPLKIARDEAKAAVAAELARLGFLDREVKRLQKLAKQNNAARTQLDETEAEQKVTKSDLVAAQARLRNARRQLSKSTIAAPFDGVVSARLLRAGDWAGSGDPVAQMLATGELEVRTSAPLSLRPYLQSCMPINISDGRTEVSAPLCNLVAAGDSRSRLMTLRLELKNSPWLIGQLVKVALPTAKPQTVLTVPRDALVLRRGGAHLFKIDAESKAQRVSVQTGVAMGEYVEIKGDLAAGDKVVTRGNERLRPGQAVNVIGGGHAQAGGS